MGIERDTPAHLGLVYLQKLTLKMTVWYLSPDGSSNVLKNPDAAEKHVNDVETAILERLYNPLVFELYPLVKKRKS